MINKLKVKVFWILMLSISVVLLGIITLFAVLNYNNTINAATFMMDRFNEFPKEPNNNQSETYSDENRISIDLSNTYTFMFEEGKIMESSKTKNSQVQEYAIKVFNKNKEKGTIENYVYKIRSMKDGRTMVVLVKDESVVSRINFIYIFTVLGVIISIICTYIISKKLSNIIVKPVEETIEKQKRFISDASHELKTPLAVIEANADVLESKIGKSKWMDYIQYEITSMDKLINNLLFLAKAENLKDLNTKEMFDLSEEVKMTTSIFESMAYEKKIKLKYNVKDNISFNGNREDVKQILSVLIENAIMHTKENGETIVELTKEKNNIIIQVKNEGEPIPEEEKEKIFERFYRVDKSRNRKEKRYGLGLAIAKSIVEQYNGKIQVDCKEGVTNFRIIL